MDILQVILLVLGNSAISALVSALVSHWSQQKLLKAQLEHDTELKQLEFFKNIAGTEQQNLLLDWVAMLDEVSIKTKNDHPMGKSFEQKFKTLRDKTFLYGSWRTAKLVVANQQNVFNENPDNMLTMAFISSIISSLKNDFMGVAIDPADYTKLFLSQKDFKTLNLDIKFKEVEKILSRS